MKTAILYSLLALSAVFALIAITPLHAQVIRTIRTDDISADIVDQEVGFELRLPDTTLKINDMVRLLIRKDGLYEQLMTGELRLITETRGPLDQKWLSLKGEVEAFRVEVQDYPELLQTFLDFDISATPVRDINDLSWTFDQTKFDDMNRLLPALSALVNARKAGTLRIAGTASKILIGFPPAQTPAPLYWPLDSNAWLYLDPKADPQTSFFNDALADHILVGQPEWFTVTKTLENAENPGILSACLPFGGCGYVEAINVAPVRPIWVAVDRETMKPVEMWID